MIQSPRGMTIMEAYELHRKNMLLVNRRYQRKLVWTVQEKQRLIDSILSKYPVPLILFASIEDGKFEIIDGMQRLNAFFGFIENQFPILRNGEEVYFSVKDYTFAQSQADKGVFNAKISTKTISQEEVSSFISYPFPATIFISNNYDDINETFRRINASGRHLSAQEVRQAGNTTQFSSIVRTIASEIRGDASKEVLLLAEMPEISIDSKQSSFGYGINAEDTFWCKQGILRVSELRESEDEQFVADLILSILLNTAFPASKREFDNYYGSGEVDKSNEIELKLKAIGYDNVAKDIKLVLSEILNFAEHQIGGMRLKNLLNPSAGSNPVKEAFYTLFMSFYDLMINQNMIPFDYTKIKKAVNDLHKKLPKGKGNYTTNEGREENIKICKALIIDHFKKSETTFRSSSTYTIDFQVYLMRSKVESAVYDYKQGLYNLNPKERKFEDKVFENKVIHNIAALANLGKEKKGYLFLGVTDKEADTLQVEKLDNLENVPRYYNFGIVGLEREAKIKGVSLDSYISFITKKISDSKLPNDLKTRISKSITPITYHGKTILMIEVECGKEPIYYEDKMYQRDGANCVEVMGAKQGDVFKLFN